MEEVRDECELLIYEGVLPEKGTKGDNCAAVQTWGEQQVSLKHTNLRHACPLFSCLLFLYSLENFVL